jgi:hypothetical protein
VNYDPHILALKKDIFENIHPENLSQDQLSEDLKYLIEIASLINERYPDNKEELDIDFTSLILAFLHSNDEISHWFQVYVRQADVELDAIYSSKSLDKREIDREIHSLDLRYESVTIASKRLSRSADGIFQEAIRLMNVTYDGNQTHTPPVLDVRHVMGAYIYGPHVHYAQLTGWRFDYDRDWPNAFLSHLRLLVSPGELTKWIFLHRTKKSSEPIIESRLSPYIATDKSTADDQLDYRMYAYAVARFLTHPQTIAPISISIQAPWGGGKTSLMKMIRKELDENADQEEYPGTNGKLTLRKLKSLLKERAKRKNKLEIPAFDSSGLEVKQRVTIWFNAWRYESTEQVWAGLADSIVREVVHRMKDPFERDWFLLQLNIHREGAKDVLDWITSHIRTYLWNTVRPWLWTSLVAAGSSIIVLLFGEILGILGLAGSAALTGIPTGIKKLEVEKNPPDISLSNYLRIPDYSKSLGYIHNVVEDLKIVFNTIPGKYLPMVIFVDDLDRCSPSKIAQVIEGINLFLAGEFEQCIFVIGMDPEMVGAALEAHHSEVISKLPKYSASTPIGWRFMDKFVQLPVVIPPSIQSDVKHYIKNLLTKAAENKNRLPTPSASVDTKSSSSREGIDITGNAKIRRERKANGEERATRENIEKKLQNYPLEQRETILRAAHRINLSSDEDEDLRNEILQASMEFSSNPREIKRFLNMVRFQRFLREAMLAANKPNKQKPPSLPQLYRWITLLLKWPGVVRWLYWSSGATTYKAISGEEVNLVRERLTQLENIGAESSNQKDWQKKIVNQLLLNSDSVSWMNDEKLWKFFNEEGKRKPISDRLSASVGKGLY